MDKRDSRVIIFCWEGFASSGVLSLLLDFLEDMKLGKKLDSRSSMNPKEI
jgi:hypothetical protein